LLLLELARRDVEVARGVIERRLADIALGLEVAIALELLARKTQVGLGLDECMLRGGKSRPRAAAAAAPRSVRNRGFRLQQGGALVAVVKLDQHVTSGVPTGLRRRECARLFP
jgi:hypothetical protein